MQTKIFLINSLYLEKLSQKNIHEFITIILKYNKEIKMQKMAFSMYDTAEKLRNYLHTFNDSHNCFYIIKKQDKIIGYISIGTFFDWNEVSFYLLPNHRSIKQYCDNKYSFSDLVTIFLKAYFKYKRNKLILMWGTRDFNNCSKYMAQKLGFIYGYSVNDENQFLSNKPMKSNIFFINKKIFIKNLKKVKKAKYYTKLLNSIKKSKMSLINEESYLYIDKLIINDFF